MAKEIHLLENTVVVLQNDNGASTSNGAGVKVGTQLDNRAAGNGIECFWFNFELKSAFGVAPAAGQPIDLYAVPYTDGTNSADVASSIPQPTMYVGSFLTLAQSTTTRMPLMGVPLQPLLYDLYVVNNSGQTMSLNWGLRVVPAEEQYNA